MKSLNLKPVILIKEGEINHGVDDAEKHLSATGKYYQRGGLIVTIITDPDTNNTRLKK